MRFVLKLALLCCALAICTTAQNGLISGYSNVGINTSTGQNDESALTQVIAPINSTIANCQLYISTAGSGAVGCALIDTDGTESGMPCQSSCPGTVLCAGHTSGTPAANSWNTITMAPVTGTGCTLTSNHAYWLAENLTGSATTVNYDTLVGDTDGYYFPQACCTFVNFGATPSQTGGLVGSIFLNLVQTTNTPCGVTAAQTSVQGSGSANGIGADAVCTPLLNSTVSDCQIYVAAESSVNFGCAVYDSTGVGGIPGGSPLCSGTGSSASLGWKSVSLSGCGSLTANHVYWIAINGDTADMFLSLQGPVGNVGTGIDYSYPYACCTFGSFSASPTQNVIPFSAYLDLSSTRHTAYVIHSK
jgi:hypothetical protein